MNIETANRLVQLRKENGLSQEALAAKLGISRQAISKWERAEASPDTDNLIALAELYGMSLDTLLNTMNDESIEDNANGNAENKAKKEKLPKKPRQLLGVKLLKFPTPIFIVIIYLIMGFFFDFWHPGWIVMLLIPIYYHFAGGICCYSDKATLLAMPVPEIIVAIYLMLGFATGFWHPAWIMFLIIPLYYWLISVFYKPNKEKKAK
ncbi:MAG: helix-turn-helix transcriptional regulator [Oscillospiraceae bacterium]